VESLSGWFEKKFSPAEHPAGSPPQVFTVIGSGGKTSLIWLLAQSLRAYKVLVSPTTKMYPPPPELHRYDYFFSRRGPPPSPFPARAGISLAGLLNEGTGKLEALPPAALEKMVSACDLVFLEGDGSQGLPFKGWADHEPVVPLYTSVTIGIIPIAPLGEKVSERLIFRLPQFMRLSGAKEGDTLSPAHLAAAITGTKKERGLFSAARGKKLLFINQAEDEAHRDDARTLVSLLPRDFLAELERILCGSVEQNRAEVLYP
jgi:probable selenium-dependent hydroxylase accessory protein YqeC